jgi:hypothetical protein
MMSVNVPPISVPTSHFLFKPFISFLVQPLLSFSAHRTRPAATIEATLLRAAQIAKVELAMKPVGIAVEVRPITEKNPARPAGAAGKNGDKPAGRRWSAPTQLHRGADSSPAASPKRSSITAQFLDISNARSGTGCNLQLTGTTVFSHERSVNDKKSGKTQRVWDGIHLAGKLLCVTGNQLAEGSRSQDSNRLAAMAFPERNTEYGDGTVGIAKG